MKIREGRKRLAKPLASVATCASRQEAVPKVMSVALIELVEMTATLNVVVSINSTTVMQTYWTAPCLCNQLENLFFFKSLTKYGRKSWKMKTNQQKYVHAAQENTRNGMKRNSRI